MSDDEYIREANHTSHPEGVKPAHKEYIYDLGELLVRTLAIERIKELDKTAVDNYTDLQENSSK